MHFPKYVLLVFCTFLLNNSYAQFGAKAGINFSAAGSYGNSEKGETAHLKTGFQAGFFHYASLNATMTILIELNYEARGTISKKDYTIVLPLVDPNLGMILDFADYAISQKANSRQHYINLPVLLQLGGEKLKYYVGPNVGFLFAGKADFKRTIAISVDGNPLLSPPALDIKDVDWSDYDSFQAIFLTPPPESGEFLNGLEFGINIGAMYYLTADLLIDLRVNQGLLDTSNNDYDFSIYPDPNIFVFDSRSDADRNLSIQLGIAYQF